MGYGIFMGSSHIFENDFELPKIMGYSWDMRMDVCIYGIWDDHGIDWSKVTFVVGNGMDMG